VTSVLRLEGVTKSFGESVLFEQLDLTVTKGQFVALLGVSGCGKSTLIRMVAGLDRDFTGEIDCDGSTATVFQNAGLLPWKRAIDNVRLGLRGPDAHERSATALAEVGLTDRARAWPATLSGGEAQRVALARALVRNPDVLLLDEPFGALDALTRIQMHALLKNVRHTHPSAVLLVTHDAEEALLLADRIIVLRDRQLALDETVALPTPRRRTDPDFQQARLRVLRAIGIDPEVVE